MRKAKAGFTLIELLVVIAIIAILAAILFPIFTTAQENSRRTKCISQLKQIGVATTSYADDNQGYLPPYPSTNWDTMSIMKAKLKSYSGNSDRIWLCPSDHGYKYPTLNVKPSFFAYYGSSYLYNWNTYSAAQPTNKAKLVSVCKSPRQLVLYWDWVSHPTGSTWVQNTVFGDNHVKGLDYRSLANGVNVTTAELF